MKKYMLLFIILAALFFLAIKLSIANDEARPWNSFLSGYYGVPSSQIGVFSQKGLSWGDIATGFLFSKLSGIKPEVIMSWKLGGSSWIIISDKIKLPIDKIYVSLPPNAHIGPPYGKAYGYWKKRGIYRLTDDDFRHLVLLKATSEHYKLSPTYIMSQVEKGGKFSEIIMNKEKTKIVPVEHLKDQSGHSKVHEKENTQKIEKDLEKGNGPPSWAGKGKKKH